MWRSKKLTILFIVFIIIFLTACKEKEHIVLEAPNKIIIYSKGEQIELDKDNEHFQTILKLTNERIPNYDDYLTSISEDAQKEILENYIGLEFTYESKK